MNGTKEIYETLAHEMEDMPQIDVDFNNYEMFDLCCSLKYYFREIKDGILPEMITKALYYAFLNDKQKDLKMLSKYLRGSLYGERKKFLSEILDLYRTVDKFKYYNMMGIDNLLICSMPSFFPNVPIVPKKIEIVSVMRLVIESLIVEVDSKYPEFLIEKTKFFFKNKVKNFKVRPIYESYTCC